MTTKTVIAEGSPLIESREQLIASFARGEKPRERWRIGTEHEKFVYQHDRPSRPELRTSPAASATLLIELQQYGWQPGRGRRKPHRADGGDGSVSLEPAGQLELSGAPLDNLHQTCAETGRHLDQVKASGEKLGIGFLGLGMWPDKTRDRAADHAQGPLCDHAAPHAARRQHGPRHDAAHLHDPGEPRLCVAKPTWRRSSASGWPCSRSRPRCSPTRPSPKASPTASCRYRSHIWSDTDPARTGMLPFVFEDGFGYERYADYMLDVPMYFVYRDGKYIDAAGLVVPRLPEGRTARPPG